MTVTVHPDRGQPLSDLARALLAVANDPREVRAVTGGRAGYLVPDVVAHTYLSGRLGVQAPPSPLSLLGVATADSVPVANPAPESAVDAPAPAPGPLDVFVPPVVEPVPDSMPEPEPPKRGPGRPRKTAQPATTSEVS